MSDRDASLVNACALHQTRYRTAVCAAGRAKLRMERDFEEGPRSGDYGRRLKIPQRFEIFRGFAVPFGPKTELRGFLRLTHGHRVFTPASV